MGEQTNDRKGFYRIDYLPESVNLELEDAAKAADLSTVRALRYIFDHTDLHEAVRQGLLREGEFDKEETKSVGFHLPASTRAAVFDAAKGKVNTGAVGRLILIGLSGQLLSRVRKGFLAELEEAEAEKVAS